LVAGAVLFLTAAGAFLAIALSASHQRYMAAADDDLQNLTLNLERYLFARLQSTDVVLQSAAQAYTDLSGEPDVRQARFTAALMNLQQWLPTASALRATDGEGRVIHGLGLNPSAEPLSVAERQFFREARDRDDLVIGLPLRSRVSERWVLPLARSLHDNRGLYAGVVYLTLDLEELGAMMRALRIGEHGVITLFNQRREVLMRLPELLPSVDEKPVRLSALETQKALAAGLATARFTTRSSIDGEERALMYRQIGGYPVYILAGLSRAETLAPWRTELGITVLFWLALAGGAVALLATERHAGGEQLRAMRELDRARKLAESANASKSLFLANMSHEIRTPLNGVLGFAQIGHRDPDASPQARQHFGRILAAGQLLQGILNDVLDMSKIEAGKLRLEAAPTLLRPLLDSAWELVAPSAADKGLHLRQHIDPHLPERVVIDPLRLGQVLLNLLSNAVKFTDAGEVALSVSAEGHTLRIAVSDTGVGMSAEEVARLFRSFEQADPSTTRRYGGTGLGLAISKRLVEMMSGTIEVTSAPGEGSVFAVRLPMLVGEAPGGGATGAPATAAASPRPAPRLAGLHLLVAEDNPVNQIVIESMLALEGAQVTLVADGNEAIDRVNAQAPGGPRFDALLLDVMMPGIDGYETARRVRGIDPGLPIIGQTAHALPEVLQLCLDAGMVARLTKPIDLQTLVQTVRAHCRAPAPTASSADARR